jgi:hypothetical protein
VPALTTKHDLVAIQLKRSCAVRRDWLLRKASERLDRKVSAQDVIYDNREITMSPNTNQ